MSAELMLRDPAEVATGDGNLLLRWENTVNTPIISATWRGNGQAIAGTYVLTFEKNGSVSVDVEAQGQGATSRNPWGDRSGLAVVADDSTPNLDLVPGVAIVVSSSTDTAWEAKITIGNQLDGSTPFDHTVILEFEVVTAGGLSSNRQIACRNIGSEIAQGTTIYSLPGFYHDGTGAETFIEELVPHSDPTRHKLAPKSTKVITFADWKLDGGSGKWTADVYVDGNKAIEDAQFDGLTQYEYGVAGYDDANDYLAGLGIVFPDTTTDPTSASITLMIREGWQWLEFAPDVAGVPGTFAAADLVLGDIDPNDHELFWARVNMPSAVQPEDPCRMMFAMARGLSI